MAVFLSFAEWRTVASQYRLLQFYVLACTPPALLLGPSSDCSPLTHLDSLTCVRVALKLPGAPLLSNKVRQLPAASVFRLFENIQTQWKSYRLCHPFPDVTLGVHVSLYSVNDAVAFPAPGSRCTSGTTCSLCFPFLLILQL